eukprot:366490-Chlamydomonas_euryale.AAC.11
MSRLHLFHFRLMDSSIVHYNGRAWCNVALHVNEHDHAQLASIYISTAVHQSAPHPVPFLLCRCLLMSCDASVAMARGSADDSIRAAQQRLREQVKAMGDAYSRPSCQDRGRSVAC